LSWLLFAHPVEDRLPRDRQPLRYLVDCQGPFHPQLPRLVPDV